MKFCWPLHVSFIFLFFLNSNWGQTAERLKDEISKIIQYDTDITFDQVPGFLIGIIDGDSTYILTFGDSLSADFSESSIFELGGLTKVFVAHLVHKLAQQGELELSASINDYLPIEYRNSKLIQISIKNLLTHTSGFISRPNNLGQKESHIDDPYQNYTKTDLLNYLKGISHPGKLGKYIYAHQNYALLEVLLEYKTGSTLNDLLSKHLFIPHGMENTFIADGEQDITPGFDRSGRLVEPWHFASFAGSEGMRSTCKDLTQYMQNLLLQIKDTSSFSTLLIPYVKLTPRRHIYAADGWHLFKNKRKGNLYLHSGKTDGHAASIHFKLKTRTAVILLTNSPGSMDGLSTLVLRMINNNWRRKK